MQTYKVINGQNLYDVALALYGSIEGVFDLLINNPELSFETVLQAGDELYWDEDYVVNSDVVDTLQSSLYITPANGERHVYYKQVDKTLRCMITIDANEPSMKLKFSGDGNMTVDWGDNSDLEEFTLQSTMQTYGHFFDNSVEKRVVRLYGDFNVKEWILSTINGTLQLVVPIIVDEVVSEYNNVSLNGLFLFKDTYSVKLAGMSIDNLDFIRNMSLSDLILADNEYTDASVVDDYLIYIAKHNNQRRACKVKLDIAPNGVYQEPNKDDNGNYDIQTGMEAVYVITHEEAWNEAGNWEFNIAGAIYKYGNSDIA